MTKEKEKLKKLIAIDKDGYATLVLQSDGDPSVGISGDYATVKLWLGPDVAVWAFYWSTLRQTFRDLWDNGSVEAYFETPVCDSQNHETQEEAEECGECSGHNVYEQIRLLTVVSKQQV